MKKSFSIQPNTIKTWQGAELFILVPPTNKEFNGLGTCVNIDNPDIGQMEQLFDLDEPSLPGLCNKTVEESCCTCLKKKTCRDTGCSSQFGGEGNGILRLFKIVLTYCENLQNN